MSNYAKFTKYVLEHLSNIYREDMTGAETMIGHKAEELGLAKWVPGVDDSEVGFRRYDEDLTILKLIEEDYDE